MSDILTKDIKQTPRLILAIISKYKCKRCHQVFNKVSKVAVDIDQYNLDKNTKYVCGMIINELEKISNSRDTQMHFCNHDKDDVGFISRSDVVDYVKYKINNNDLVEVGPAEYLGSNIIKDKLSVDIDEADLINITSVGFSYNPDPNTDSEEKGN